MNGLNIILPAVMSLFASQNELQIITKKVLIRNVILVLYLIRRLREDKVSGGGMYYTYTIIIQYLILINRNWQLKYMDWMVLTDSLSVCMKMWSVHSSAVEKCCHVQHCDRKSDGRKDGGHRRGARTSWAVILSSFTLEAEAWQEMTYSFF